jgi:hypothetical protein
MIGYMDQQYQHVESSAEQVYSPLCSQKKRCIAPYGNDREFSVWFEVENC